MLAIVIMFVWQKRTKGKAGIRWDKVVENVWKEIGGNQEEIMSIYDGGGVLDKSKGHDRTKRK